MTRGLLIIGALSSGYRVCWTAFGESEAQRHQNPNAAKIADLRQHYGWKVLVPEVEATGMIDTDEKDTPHLAAAHEAGARLIITNNIKDFGCEDLSRLSMSVVTPDLFLSLRLDEQTYVGVLETLAEGRQRDPRTPAGIHGQEVARQLPTLALTFMSTFDTPLAPPAHNPMAEVFRGCRCVRCEELLDLAGHSPICDSCRALIRDQGLVL